MQHFIFITAFTLCSIYLLIQLIYLLILSKLKKREVNIVDNLPTVSILVAARNEAKNIVDCLNALNQLDYPEDRIEIIIGNDQSTDYTQMLVENFIRNKPKFRLINLSGSEHQGTKGKARVLATLARAAKGEYYLITDADIVVGPQWAKAMVSTMVNDQVDMVGGTTNIQAEYMLDKYQQVDWLYFMGIIHSFASIGRNLTVVGNNMGISAKAYNAVGGYESIPFSITEDYALFKAFKNKGFKTSQRLNNETMVYSKPLDTIKAILKQRKRWLTGGWELPFYYHVIMFIFGAWYFAMPVLFLMNWKLSLILLLVKDFVQLFQLLSINKKLSLQVEHPIAVLTYELYLFFMIPLTSIYFLTNRNTTWKGRKY